MTNPFIKSPNRLYKLVAFNDYGVAAAHARDTTGGVAVVAHHQSVAAFIAGVVSEKLRALGRGVEYLTYAAFNDVITKPFSTWWQPPTLVLFYGDDTEAWGALAKEATGRIVDV